MSIFLDSNELAGRLSDWKVALELNISDKVNVRNAALLVLDMQNDFLLDTGQMPVWGGQAVLPGIKRLLSAFHTHNLPVFYTRHLCIEPYRHKDELGSMKGIHDPDVFLKDGTRGAEIHANMKPSSSDYVVTKYRYSGFYDTPLDTLLRVNRISDLVIAGVATNICCETTAHDAFFRGYNVVFTVDGTGGTDEQAHLATLRNIKLSYGVLATIDQVVMNLPTSGKDVGV